MKIIVQRYKYDQNQTTGVLSVFDKDGWLIFTCPCIERGDKGNQRNVSNIPPGTYPIVLEWSPRFNTKLWELKDVPNRSEVKIHASNHWHQLNGCIALGTYLTKIDGDNYIDLGASKRALNSFHRIMRGQTKTTIQIINPTENGY
jgi:hypothetical protein